MTQPSIAPPLTVEYLRRASVAVYLACEEPVAADISKHLKWAADRIEELKARAEQAEQAVDVLESNAREQAKLLADTGRRVEELAALIEFWTSDRRLQTFEDRQRFRKAALAALPPSSSTGLTDMTLKARNDALHENNVLALRQIEELEAALLAAREYVAGASLAAGTPAYIRCCELLIKIDAALPPSTPAVSR